MLSCTTEELPDLVVGSITCDGVPIIVSTIGAANDIATYSPYTAPDVAYTLTLTQPSRIELSTCGSYFDTYLHLYSANGNMLDEMLESCDDCGTCDFSPSNEVLLTADFLEPGETI